MITISNVLDSSSEIASRPPLATVHANPTLRKLSAIASACAAIVVDDEHLNRRSGAGGGRRLWRHEPMIRLNANQRKGDALGRSPKPADRSPLIFVGIVENAFPTHLNDERSQHSPQSSAGQRQTRKKNVPW